MSMEDTASVASLATVASVDQIPVSTPEVSLTATQRAIVKSAFENVAGSSVAAVTESVAAVNLNEDGTEEEVEAPEPAPAPAGAPTISSQQFQDLLSDLFGTPLIERDFLFLLDAQEKENDAVFTYEQYELAVSQHMVQTTRWGKLATTVNNYVGFDLLAQQVHRRKLKAGFQFNLMVAGASGLGKSTMVDTLFGGKIARGRGDGKEIPQTVEIEQVSHVIEEKGIRLRLTVIDSPGFGDQVDNSNAWESLIDYQTEQFERYYAEETAVFRKRDLTDTRVHCLLYFIAPTGHYLKPFDIEAMRNLAIHFNLVPVIAKSDSLTIEERNAFRKRIQADLEKHDVHVYPQIEEDDDEEDKDEKKTLFQELPYAIIGSSDFIEVSGKKVLGRQMPWAYVEVENSEHCEYNKLRDMLIRTRMHDLIETTHIGQYAEFRVDRIEPEVEDGGETV